MNSSGASSMTGLSTARKNYIGSNFGLRPRVRRLHGRNPSRLRECVFQVEPPRRREFGFGAQTQSARTAVSSRHSALDKARSAVLTVGAPTLTRSWLTQPSFALLVNCSNGRPQRHVRRCTFLVSRNVLLASQEALSAPERTRGLLARGRGGTWPRSGLRASREVESLDS